MGKSLDKKLHNSGDVALTPYEQAKRYDNYLPVSEKARYIITSNFNEIWIYDMDKRDPEKNVEKIYLKDLQKDFYRLGFLVKSEDTKITKEMDVSIKGGSSDDAGNACYCKDKIRFPSTQIIC